VPGIGNTLHGFLGKRQPRQARGDDRCSLFPLARICSADQTTPPGFGYYGYSGCKAGTVLRKSVLPRKLSSLVISCSKGKPYPRGLKWKRIRFSGVRRKRGSTFRLLALSTRANTSLGSAVGRLHRVCATDFRSAYVTTGRSGLTVPCWMSCFTVPRTSSIRTFEIDN